MHRDQEHTGTKRDKEAARSERSGMSELHWSQTSNSITKIDLLCLEQVIQKQRFFSCSRVLFQERLAINTAQQPAAERWGEKKASTLDEKIVCGSLGDFSLLIQKDHVGIATFLGKTTGPIIE